MKKVQKDLYELAETGHILELKRKLNIIGNTPEVLYFNVKKDLGFSILHRVIATTKTNSEAIEAITKLCTLNKELLNLRDDYGFTALHHAVMLEKIEFAKELITLGADINIMDGNMNKFYDHIRCIEDYNEISEVCDIPEWNAIQSIKKDQRQFERMNQCTGKVFEEEYDHCAEMMWAIKRNWIRQVCRLCDEHMLYINITVRHFKDMNAYSQKKFIQHLCKKNAFKYCDAKLRFYIYNYWRYKKNNDNIFTFVARKGYVDAMNHLAVVRKKKKYKTYLLVFLEKLPSIFSFIKRKFNKLCHINLNGKTFSQYVNEYVKDGMGLGGAKEPFLACDMSEEEYNLLYRCKKNPNLTKEVKRGIKRALNGAIKLNQAVLEEIQL